MNGAPIATGRSVTGIPTAKLAVWWLIASELVLFGGLLACYIMMRLKFDHWALDASHTSTVMGSINTFILLTSSLFAVLAHYEAEKGNGVRAFWYLWATIGGALGFLIVKGMEWSTEISLGYTITKSPFWSYYYTAAGIHGLHVIAGAVAMAIVSVGALKNKNLHRVELVGLYWHFVDIVWIFLFPLLYIAK